MPENDDPFAFLTQGPARRTILKPVPGGELKELLGAQPQVGAGSRIGSHQQALCHLENRGRD